MRFEEIWPRECREAAQRCEQVEGQTNDTWQVITIAHIENLAKVN